MHLHSPVHELRGVGPALEARLLAMGLRRIEDLLFHLPLRYQDRRRLWPLAGVRAGQEVAVQGQITHVERIPGRREQWRVRLEDGTGCLQIRLFHVLGSMRQQWRPGRQLWCFGELRSFQGVLEMVHPEWQLADLPQFQVPQHLTPFYPSSEGIHQQQWRRWMEQALALLPDLVDPLQAHLSGDWPTLAEGIRFVHQSGGEVPHPGHPAWQRLALEELLAHHLALRRERLRLAPLMASTLGIVPDLWQRLRAVLPFSPTPAQERVIAEVVEDLRQSQPMRRLIQGDVGSGKTLVAVAVLLHVVAGGAQVALMAPTEILAAQLHQRLQEWLAPLGVTVALLSGSQGARARREALAGVADGQTAIICGTQALFQEGVHYARLGLVIIDEQHRFGVDQRRQLLEKGEMPHLLVMTATPIPRTLAMTLHADLEVSVIDALPPGRTPVETLVLPDRRRDELIARLRGLLAEGRQVYWVCPLIEESELLQLQAAEASYAQLRAALPEAAIAMVHGRQKSHEKAEIMAAFRGGETQILVATTVIEVGVDVPNASLMVIEHAERLGLAQLHQLRGRVGRGAAQSTCILLYHPPLSQRARVRLETLRASHDGFVIARKDLEMRGPGEFLGVRQSGDRQLRVADLMRDEALLEQLPSLAATLERMDPQGATLLVARWLGNGLGYADIA